MTAPEIHIPKSEAEREREVLAHYFLPYQERWIADESRNKLCEKTRRCGLTFAEEFRRVERICKAGALYDAYVTSRDEGLARQFIREAKNFAAVWEMAATDMGEVVIDRAKGISAFALEAKTGKRIYSLSSNPDTQAGRAGDRTADEFALHQQQRELYAIMRPGTKWGGQLSVFSTHRGKNSFFNQLVTEAREGGNKKQWSLHTITIEDAVREGLWIKIRSMLPEDDEQKRWTDDEFLQACRDEMPDEASFQQEYMCVPEDDAESFLTWALIVSCARRDVLRDVIDEPKAQLFLGYDVARRRDLSVITIGEMLGAVLHVRRIIVMEKTSFSDQQRLLYRLLEDRRIQRACIDASGLGMMLAEQAAEKFGTGRVSQVTFTLPVKHELAHPMKRRFEDKTIVIPDDMKLHADLRSVKTDTTSSGNILFKSEGGETDGHADRFWSLALMNHAADTLVNPGVFARLRSLIDRGQRDTRQRDRRGGVVV